jgi:hypothetical protein
MNRTEIIAMQRRIGTTPDGFWGPKSGDACRRHLLALMPIPHPFPRSAGRTAFYGPHGVKDGYTPPMKAFVPPYEMRPYTTLGNKLTRIFAHEKCADSLEAALVDIAETFDPKEIRHYGLDLFFGVYNPRTVRGSATAISNHAWAAAIDLDAHRNGNRSHWPTASKMPLEAMECFARMGWAAGGAFWNRDGMHFEAVQL